jgi:NTE family protein
VQTLAREYEKRLTGLGLGDLPPRPRFVLCATDMAFGVNWIFEKSHMGDYRAGYVEPPPASWTLGRATAASSCFPPVFNPMPVRVAPGSLLRGNEPRGEEREAAISDLRLTDGGVYDNLGLEPVWKSHATLLVSDGGAPFGAEPDRGLFHRLGRYSQIIMSQVGALRKRWLISNFLTKELSGTYWGVGSAVANYGLEGWPGYSEHLVDTVVSPIRTDLDAFSEAEVAVLENHGYMLTAVAIERHAPELVQSHRPAVAPYPEWMDEDLVGRALEDSDKRRIFGRG